MQLKVRLAIIGLLVSVIPTSSKADDDATWNRLKPYFEPPAEFAQQFGEYSSPLQFTTALQLKTLPTGLGVDRKYSTAGTGCLASGRR